MGGERGGALYHFLRTRSFFWPRPRSTAAFNPDLQCAAVPVPGCILCSPHQSIYQPERTRLLLQDRAGLRPRRARRSTSSRALSCSLASVTFVALSISPSRSLASVTFVALSISPSRALSCSLDLTLSLSRSHPLALLLAPSRSQSVALSRTCMHLCARKKGGGASMLSLTSLCLSTPSDPRPSCS